MQDASFILCENDGERRHIDNTRWGDSTSVRFEESGQSSVDCEQLRLRERCLQVDVVFSFQFSSVECVMRPVTD